MHCLAGVRRTLREADAASPSPGQWKGVPGATQRNQEVEPGEEGSFRLSANSH